MNTWCALLLVVALILQTVGPFVPYPIGRVVAAIGKVLAVLVETFKQ